MGTKNYLIEGVSCTGKTSVCRELQKRGYHTVDGDTELAYWGDPKTGEAANGNADENRAWIWNVSKVQALVADRRHAETFFCGGSRNSDRFIALFDNVFVLEIDLDTLNRRLAARPRHEWGGTASEGESFARLQHATKTGLPESAIRIDATASLARVLDTILDHAKRTQPEEPRRLLKKAYEAFNARHIDAVLALMCDDVVWPNGMEGGVVRGHSEVRAYWTRQWTVVNPNVIPLSITEESRGCFDVEVHQRVKDMQGTILVDRIVHHVYRMREGRIASMEVRE